MFCDLPPLERSPWLARTGRLRWCNPGTWWSGSPAVWPAAPPPPADDRWVQVVSTGGQYRSVYISTTLVRWYRPITQYRSVGQLVSSVARQSSLLKKTRLENEMIQWPTREERGTPIEFFFISISDLEDRRGWKYLMNSYVTTFWLLPVNSHPIHPVIIPPFFHLSFRLNLSIQWLCSSSGSVYTSVVFICALGSCYGSHLHLVFHNHHNKQSQLLTTVR